MMEVPEGRPRGVELSALAADVEAARGGAGRLVVLSGPAGIGKTWLAEAALRRAADLGLPGVRLRCPDDEGVPALWPWSQLLRRLVERELIPLAEPGLFTPPAEDGEAARFRVLDAFATAIVSAAAPGGLFVVLEDLHWVDPASLRLLRHLSGEIASSRVVLVVTTRPGPGVGPTDPAGSALAAAVEQILRRPGCRLLEVQPFGPAQIGRLLAELSGHPAGPRLVAEVQRRTGGNPLLVGAVARVLAGRPGRIDAGSFEAGSFDAGPGAEGVLWQRIAQAADLGRLASSLLARLGPVGARVICAGAVAGEVIEPALLAEICELTEAEVRAELAPAVLAGTVELTGSPVEYRFAHALIRDAIIERLDPADRQEWHAALALALGRRAAGEPDVIPRWAAHLIRSGSDPQTLTRAGEAAAAAAREAGRRLAFEDAAHWWQVAIRAGDRAGHRPEQRIDPLLELAAAQYRAGDFAGSLEHCGRAVALATEHDRPVAVAAAALVMQGLGAPEVGQAVLLWCDQALASPAVTDLVLRSRLLAQKACVLAEFGQTGEASSASVRALDLARSAGDPGALLEAARARSMLLSGPEHAGEKLELGALAVREATTLNRPLAAVWGHLWRSDIAYLLGNLDTVDAETEAVAQLAEHSRLPLARWFHLRLLATRALLEGRFDEGAAASSQALHLALRMGDRSAAGLSYAYVLNDAMIRGRPDLLDADAERALAGAPRMPIVQVSEGVHALVRGDRDRARTGLEEARPVLAAPSGDGRWYGAVCLLVELIVAFDDEPAARLATAALEPWAAFRGGIGISTVLIEGVVQRNLGRLAAVEGRAVDAEQLLEQAVAGNLRLGARPFVVLSRLELAQVIAGDEVLTAARAARAAELARRSEQEAARLGMPGARAQALVLLARIEATAGRTAVLTAREQEIAVLVAQALSNREVAARLVLSERTVESHVRNILAKLGFSTRTEIATWAVANRATR